MSEPKYGRLPIQATEDLIRYVEVEDISVPHAGVYTILWWLADNGWDIVKRVPHE